MTYILGSCCSDGVVIVADRKFTVDYGSSYIYDDKVFQIVDGIVELLQVVGVCSSCLMLS